MIPSRYHVPQMPPPLSTRPLLSSFIHQDHLFDLEKDGCHGGALGGEVVSPQLNGKEFLEEMLGR